MPGRIRILLFTTLWKRPEITEICFLGIERLKSHPDFEIIPFAVISEDDMIPLCEKYGIKWLMHENQPLGKKKNAGLRFIQRFDFDWMMEIGSDDLVLNSLLDDYKHLIGRFDFFGISDIAFIDSTDGECKRYINRQTNYGAGRMIKRSVLERFNWEIWDNQLDRTMDATSHYKISVKGKVPYHKLVPGEFPKVIDIKSEVGIWAFNAFRGVDYDRFELYKHLSTAEFTRIESLIPCLEPK